MLQIILESILGSLARIYRTIPLNSDKTENFLIESYLYKIGFSMVQQSALGLSPVVEIS